MNLMLIHRHHIFRWRLCYWCESRILQCFLGNHSADVADACCTSWCATILINLIRRVDSASYQDVCPATDGSHIMLPWRLQTPAECLLLDSVRSISSLVSEVRTIVRTIAKAPNQLIHLGIYYSDLLNNNDMWSCAASVAARKNKREINIQHN